MQRRTITGSYNLSAAGGSSGPAATSRRNSGDRPASDSQISKLKRLLQHHALYDGAYDRLWKRLEVHEIDVLRRGDGTRMTSQDASKFIEWLIAKHGDQPPAEMGVYRRKEGNRWRYFVVREFEPDDKPGVKVRYARELVPLRDTQGARMSGDGEAVRYDEQPARGMQWELLPAELMELEDVVALSIKSGNCVVCHHKLRLEESQRRMIGPVCAGRQRDALAKRDALELVTDATGGAA